MRERVKQIPSPNKRKGMEWQEDPEPTGQPTNRGRPKTGCCGLMVRPRGTERSW